MAGYYDLVLGLIPLALFGVTGALTVAGLELATAVPVGATVSVGLIGHAMFVRAPVDPEPVGDEPRVPTSDAPPADPAGAVEPGD